MQWTLEGSKLHFLSFKHSYHFGYTENFQSFILISYRVLGPCWPISFSFSMHSSRESIWMLFSSINFSFSKNYLFCMKFAKIFGSYTHFNTVINNFWYDGMTRIYDVLKYSTIMNIYYPTFADWRMMTHFTNLANLKNVKLGC